MAAQGFLLDTNILSDLIRHPNGVVAGRIEQAGEQGVCTSIIVACELRFGAARKNSSALSDRVEALLDVMDVRAFEDEADRHYARIRTALSRNGSPIGPNDMLIAAHARALGMAVVTANVREFSRVPGLPVENWLSGETP